MKNVVLFRLQDEDTVWMADLEAGTVEQTDSDTAIGASDAPFIKGIDFALAAKARPTAASHFLFPSR